MAGGVFEGAGVVLVEVGNGGLLAQTPKKAKGSGSILPVSISGVPSSASWAPLREIFPQFVPSRGQCGTQPEEDKPQRHDEHNEAHSGFLSYVVSVVALWSLFSDDSPPLGALHG